MREHSKLLFCAVLGKADGSDVEIFVLAHDMIEAAIKAEGVCDETGDSFVISVTGCDGALYVTDDEDDIGDPADDEPPAIERGGSN